MPAMKSALNFTSGDGASIAAVQTVGLSAGKLLNGGWPVDIYGARRTYIITMTLLALLASTYSLMRRAAGVALVAFLVEFFSTPIFPCHVAWIRGWLAPEASGNGFWLLGLASRSGDVISKLSYGSLLSFLTWQQATWPNISKSVTYRLTDLLTH